MLDLKEIVLSILCSLAIVAVLGPVIIPMLARLKFGQTVREEGPRSHLKKNGTPTMGGVLMMIAILFVGAMNAKSPDMIVGLMSIIGFGLIGFIDDFIIIKRRTSMGLNAKQKIVLQFVLAVAISYYQYSVSPDAARLVIPFVDTVVNVNLLYVPIMTFIIVGTVNAVNLTDGLDGLASGVTVVVSLFFVIFSNYININNDVTILAAATIGACLGFLIFNSYPARIFMGDTGSMALGGGVAVFAVLTNSTLIIPIAGGVYFAEALSVIIQVLSFKFRGKRVFKMAPIHHHFEQCGWAETKVVALFYIVATILGCVAILGVL